MSDLRKAAVFLLLTFCIGWSALIAAWIGGARSLSEAAGAGLLNVFSPALAALICTLVFDKGHRLHALGLVLRPNRWWLWAAGIGAGLGIFATIVSDPAALFAIDGPARPLSVLGASAGSAPLSFGKAAGLLPVALVGFALFFTLSEELGWRGYAYHLLRRFGFWRYSLGLGLVWGLWHWPINYLFGLNHPEHPLLDLLLFPIFCALLSVPMTLVRDRGKSVFAAGIFHGAWNCVSLMAALFVVSDGFWSNSGLSAIAAALGGALLVGVVRHWDAADRDEPGPICATRTV